MKPTILPALDSACPRWRAFKVCNGIVIATPDGEEILTLSADRTGATYCHDVSGDERFLGLCNEITWARIPFATLWARVEEVRS